MFVRLFGLMAWRMGWVIRWDGPAGGTSLGGRPWGRDSKGALRAGRGGGTGHGPQFARRRKSWAEREKEFRFRVGGHTWGERYELGIGLPVFSAGQGAGYHWRPYSRHTNRTRASGRRAPRPRRIPGRGRFGFSRVGEGAGVAPVSCFGRGQPGSVGSASHAGGREAVSCSIGIGARGHRRPRKTKTG